MAEQLRIALVSKRTLVVLCALISFPAVGSYAMIDSIQILPTNPTERDTIAVHVDGYLPDSCWFLDGRSTATLPDSLLFSIFTSDSVETLDRCFDAMTPYAVSGQYGPLPMGHYVLEVTECHVSPRHPLPEQKLLEFDVVPFTPVRSTRWGYLKVLFR